MSLSGLLGAWNLQNEERAVQPGDYIVEAACQHVGHASGHSLRKGHATVEASSGGPQR